MNDLSELFWRIVGGSAGALTALAPLVALLALRKLFPHTKHGPDPEPDAATDASHLRTLRLQLLMVLLFGIPGGLAVFALLSAVGALHAALLPTATYVFASDWLMWLSPAFFAGMLIGGCFSERWVRRRLQSDYEQYLAHQARKNGYELSPKAEKAVIGSFVLLVVVGSLMGLDNYTLVQPDRIVFNGFFALREVAYPYSEIRDIKVGYVVHNMKGGMTSRPEGVYVFTLASGEQFSDNYFPGDFSKEKRREVADYVAGQTGLTIRTVDVIEQVEF